MTGFELYWITRLDAICDVLMVVSAISFMILVICCVLYCMTEFDHDTYAIATIKSMLKLFIPIFLVSTAMVMFIPNTKEMFAIKIIPQLATVENCEKLKSMNNYAIDNALNWLKEMSKNEENK